MAEAYYIGMDLCPESTQISFYNDIKREPETVFRKRSETAMDHRKVLT